MPYVSEVYSGVHTTIANLDIENLGKFTISNNESQFRDYDEAEAKVKGIRDLTNEVWDGAKTNLNFSMLLLYEETSS